MTKRIFRAICFVALCVFLASVVLFMEVLYNYFSDIQMKQLKMQTNLAAQGVDKEGSNYFDGLAAKDYRITWIGTDGVVLFDSTSDMNEMENHLQREEIKEALAEGIGESSRYSVTLMERSLYCAKRLKDGTVIRLSLAQSTMLTLMLGMMQPIFMIFAVALLLSLILASRLAKKIVRPLNNLNLDEPLTNDCYDELAPLLRRIHSQQRQIKKQSEELEQKQRAFDTITTGMMEGIVLLDDKETILSINPAAKRLLEVKDSPIGTSVLSVYRSSELQEVLITSGKGIHTERILELCGGKYQLDVSPIMFNGQTQGSVLLFIDVTEKEKTEQIRREFTANVSHELKTPLHTISGCAELMMNGMVKQEDMADFSAKIYSESQRMIHLVEDIIKLSHLDEGAEDMKWEECDLYSLAKEIVKSLMPEAETMGVHLALKGDTAMMYGIVQLLGGIVYNLCDNAIQYNRRGGSVNVTVHREADSVCLCVADTGIGIPQEHRERIFERFYRVDKSHSQEIGGTGLGLSIVKHAVRLHHATMDLQSELDQGTTVTVHFPYNHPDDNKQ